MAIVATRWTAAENNLKRKLSSPTTAGATSTAAGVMTGADIGAPFRLPPGDPRFGLACGDMFISSASGQNRNAVASINNLRAHSVLLLFDTDDLEGSDFLTVHSALDGRAPDPVANDNVFPMLPHRQIDGQVYWRYAFGGLPLPTGRLLVHGALSRNKTDDPNNLGTSMSGSAPTIFDNVVGQPPTEWVPREKNYDMPIEAFHSNNPVFWAVQSPIDGGDGYAYQLMQGPSRSNQLALSRFSIEQADDPSRWIHLEWLSAGKRWRRDQPSFGPTSWGPMRKRVTGHVRARNRINAFGIEGTDQVGGIFKRPDGNWLLTMTPDFFPVRSGETADPDPHIRAAVVADLTDPFTTLLDVYDIPVVTGTEPEFYYGAYVVDVPWSGKGANDLAMIFSANGGGLAYVFGDARSYQFVLIKTTGWP